MIRGVFFWAGGVIFTVVMAVVFFGALPFFRARPAIPHLLIKFWAKVLLSLFCGVRLEVHGDRRVDAAGSYIIVSNHRSHMDILVASAAVPLPFLWLAKSSLFRIPVIGAAMKRAGYVPVEREKFVAASRSLDRAEEALRRGGSIWIFPEGTRTPREELGRFKRGAFLLAARTGRPILPVVLAGTDAIFAGPLKVVPVPVRVSVLQPLDPASFERGKRLPGSSPRGKAASRMAEAVRLMIQEGYDHELGCIDAP